MQPLGVRPAPVQSDASAARSMKILVVDDVPEICEMFRALWSRLRVPVDMVTEINSQRAADMVSRGGYDLVISDYRMREVDGIEVLIAARAANPLGHRVLMTGYNEVPTSLSRIQAAFVDAYVQKPLRMQDTLLLLLAFLKNDADSIGHYRAEAPEIEAYGATHELGPRSAQP